MVKRLVFDLCVYRPFAVNACLTDIKSYESEDDDSSAGSLAVEIFHMPGIGKCRQRAFCYCTRSMHDVCTAL